MHSIVRRQVAVEGDSRVGRAVLDGLGEGVKLGRVLLDLIAWSL